MKVKVAGGHLRRCSPFWPSDGLVLDFESRFDSALADIETTVSERVVLISVRNYPGMSSSLWRILLAVIVSEWAVFGCFARSADEDARVLRRQAVVSRDGSSQVEPARRSVLEERSVRRARAKSVSIEGVIAGSESRGVSSGSTASREASSGSGTEDLPLHPVGSPASASAAAHRREVALIPAGQVRLRVPSSSRQLVDLSRPVPGNKSDSIPVVVITARRPSYLQRSLEALVRVRRGADWSRQLRTSRVDGQSEEHATSDAEAGNTEKFPLIVSQDIVDWDAKEEPTGVFQRVTDTIGKDLERRDSGALQGWLQFIDRAFAIS